jgi:hypothetical protein
MVRRGADAGFHHRLESAAERGEGMADRGAATECLSGDRSAAAER